MAQEYVLAEEVAKELRNGTDFSAAMNRVLNRHHISGTEWEYLCPRIARILNKRKRKRGRFLRLDSKHRKREPQQIRLI